MWTDKKNVAFISRVPPNYPLFCSFLPTIVSILVEVAQRCYCRPEAPEGVCAGQQNRIGEGEWGQLQVQVDPAHLSGIALHFSLHVEGGTHQNIVSPGKMSQSFQCSAGGHENSINLRTSSTYPSPFRSVTAKE